MDNAYLAKGLLHDDSHKAAFANFHIRAVFLETLSHLWVHGGWQGQVKESPFRIVNMFAFSLTHSLVCLSQNTPQ